MQGNTMKKPMKIAMMVHGYIPMPRPSDMIYAPIDLMVSIAKGLGERGHEVTLFSPNGTTVHGPGITVETLNLRPLVTNQAEFEALLNNTEHLSHDVHGLWDRYMANAMYERAEKGEFDLLYFHHPESALSHAAKHPHVTTVYTIHDPIYPWYRELFELFLSPNQHFISISNNQRRDAPDLPYLATVYNGIDLKLFAFTEEREDYLLYTGRITQEKGVKEAIQVAKESNHRLLIIGPINHGSQNYFDQYIKPQLDERILYLGRMDQEQLPIYYQNAKAILTPVQWEEPFGLTTVEAMACGTPVISLHRGAAAEIIKQGETGFVVGSIAEMVEAVGKVDQIKAKACRARVKSHFSTKQMVDNYEKAFSKLVHGEEKLKPKKTAGFIKQKIQKVRDTLPKLSK